MNYDDAYRHLKQKYGTVPKAVESPDAFFSRAARAQIEADEARTPRRSAGRTPGQDDAAKAATQAAKDRERAVLASAKETESQADAYLTDVYNPKRIEVENQKADIEAQWKRDEKPRLLGFLKPDPKKLEAHKQNWIEADRRQRELDAEAGKMLKVRDMDAVKARAIRDFETAENRAKADESEESGRRELNARLAEALKNADPEQRVAYKQELERKGHKFPAPDTPEHKKPINQVAPKLPEAPFSAQQQTDPNRRGPTPENLQRFEDGDYRAELRPREAPEGSIDTLEPETAQSLANARYEADKLVEAQNLPDQFNDEVRDKNLAQSLLAVDPDAAYGLVEKYARQGDLLVSLENQRMAGMAPGGAGYMPATGTAHTMSDFANGDDEAKRLALERVLKVASKADRELAADYILTNHIEKLTPNWTPEARATLRADLDKMNALRRSKDEVAAVTSGGKTKINARFSSDTEAVATAIDQLVEKREMSKEEGEEAKLIHARQVEATENAIKNATFESESFKSWLAKNPEAANDDPEEQFEAYTSAQNSWWPIISSLVSSTISGSTVIARDSYGYYTEFMGIANSKGNPIEQAARSFEWMEKYMDKQEATAGKRPQSGAAAQAAGVGDAFGQFLPTMTLPLIVGATTTAVSKSPQAGAAAAKGTALAQIPLFAGVYALQGYSETARTLMEQDGRFTSLTELIEKDPQLGQRIHNQATNSMMKAIALSGTEYLPFEKLLKPASKLFKSKGAKTFAKWVDTALLNPGVEVLQEEVAERAMSTLKQGAANEYTEIEGLPFEQGVHIYLAALMAQNPVTLYHRNQALAKVRQGDDAIQKAQESTKHMTQDQMFSRVAEFMNEETRQKEGGPVTDIPGFNADNPQPRESYEGETLPALEYMEETLSAAEKDAPDSTRTEIRNELAKVQTALKAKRITADTMRVASAISSGIDARYARNEAAISEVASQLETLDSANPTMGTAEEISALQSRMMALIANRETLFDGEVTAEEAANFAKTRKLAEEIAQIPNEPGDPDNNGRPNGASQQAIAAAIAKAARGIPLTNAELDMTNAYGQKVFKRDKDGNVTVKADKTMASLETRSPLLHAAYTAYENNLRSIQDANQAQQEAQKGQPQEPKKPADSASDGGSQGQSEVAGDESPKRYLIEYYDEATNLVSPVMADGTNMIVEAETEQDALDQAKNAFIEEGESINPPNGRSFRATPFETEAQPKQPASDAPADPVDEGSGATPPPAPLKHNAPLAERKARAKKVWDAAKPGEVYYAEGGIEGERFRIDIKANKNGSRYAEVFSESGEFIELIPLDKEGSDPTKGQGLVFGADMVLETPAEPGAQVEEQQVQEDSGLIKDQLNKAIAVRDEMSLVARRSANARYDKAIESAEKGKRTEKAADFRSKKQAYLEGMLSTPQMLNILRRIDILTERLAGPVRAEVEAMIGGLLPTFDGGVVYIYEPRSNDGGMVYRQDTRQLVINIATIRLNNKAKVVRTAVEEWVHAVGHKNGIKFSDVWQLLPEEIKAFTLRSYSSVGASPDLHKGAEALRLFLQKKIGFTEDGRLWWDEAGKQQTTEEVADPTLRAKVVAALKEVAKYVRDLIAELTNSNASPELLSEVSRYEAAIKAEIQRLSPASQSSSDQKGGKPPARPKPSAAAPVAVAQENQLGDPITINGVEYPTAGQWAAKDPRGPGVASGTIAIVPIRSLTINTTIGQNQDRLDRDKTGAPQRLEMIRNMTPENIPLAWDAMPSITDGSPIINAEGSVIAGNNRSMAIRDLFASPNHSEKATAYEQWVASRAAAIGLPMPTEPSVLVRVMTNDGGISDFVKAANRAGTQAKTMAEMALAEANLPASDLPAFYQAAGQPEEMRDSNGRPDAAKVEERIDNAAIARLMLAAPDGPATVTRLIDSKDSSEVKAVWPILRAVGRVRDAVAPHSERLAAGISRAAQIIAQEQISRKNIETALKTASEQVVVSMGENEPSSALTQDIAAALYDERSYVTTNRGNRKFDTEETAENIAALADRLATAAEGFTPEADMFGSSETLDDKLRQVIANRNQEKKGESQPLASQSPLTPTQAGGHSRRYNDLMGRLRAGETLTPAQLRALDESEEALGQQWLFDVERTFQPAEELALEMQVDTASNATPEQQLALFSQAPGRTYESVDFSPPFDAPFGQVLSYHWVSKPAAGTGRAVSDWNQAKTNPETRRKIVHHFRVQRPNGSTRIVSLETAMGLLSDKGKSDLRARIKSEMQRQADDRAGQMTLFSQAIKTEYKDFVAKNEDIFDMESALPFIGTPQEEVAALAAFSRGGFTEMNAAPDSPVTKAILRLLDKLPPAQNVRAIHRVLGFPTQKEADDYVAGMGGFSSTQKQRNPVTSWTQDDPRGVDVGPKTNIGLDVASQFGDYNVILTLENPRTAKDVSFIYGERSDNTGLEYLLPQDTTTHIVAGKKTAKGWQITMRQTNNFPGLEQNLFSQSSNPGFYSRLQSAIEQADFGRSKPKQAQHWKGVIEKWAAADVTEEHERLVTDNMGLAGHAANKSAQVYGWDRDDAMQEASIGLMQAARTFDASAGTKFSTYATKVIANRLIGKSRRSTGLPNKKIRSISLDEQIGNSEGGDRGTRKDSIVSQDITGNETPEIHDARSALEYALDGLPEKVKDVLMRHAAGETYDEIAKSLGMTRQGANVMAARAADRIKRRLQAIGIESTDDLLPPAADREAATPERQIERDDADNEQMLDTREDDRPREADQDEDQDIRSQSVTPAQARAELGRSHPITQMIRLTGGFPAPIGHAIPGWTIEGRDRQPTIITGVFHQSEPQEVVRITTEDHRESEASLDHLWTVMDETGTERTVTTAELTPGMLLPVE